MKPTILITGGAGYIGSHTALLMAQQGYKVIIIDQLLHGQTCMYPWATFVKADFADRDALNDIFKNNTIQAVMHFAALIDVGESVYNPLDYYENNVVKTLRLLETMLTHNVKKCIFSSSCAVYGIPQSLALVESHPKNPINPYGKTKLMVEHMLEDMQHAYGMQYVALRYFNAAGAQAEYGLGEMHVPENHLIPLLLDAMHHDKPFTIFGTDHETPDGTCVRDFLHVADIAQAHFAALQHLNHNKPSDCFNIGTGSGVSVKEMVEVVQQLFKKKINLVLGKARRGDAPQLVADPSRALSLLEWKPVQSNVIHMLKSAYAFAYERSETVPLFDIMLERV